METPRILFSSDIFTVTPALVSALGFLQYLQFCISLFPPEVDDEIVEDHQSGRDNEVEQTLKNLNIHQFLKFPAFQQCIPLLFEVLKFWSPADEGFIVLGHVLKFTSNEVCQTEALISNGGLIL
ncbi:hypothetical protein MA16_Dca003799 [Dendrobium catenatum]|uniref:Uncharacterized protein n=1 Tax=Dendrobium catenatum TaxID=906689 RepID=A0A2I0WFZ8_9ASPA|nr:hypothetical protein MA16_Dca003799 [Dendrobium catenatum]